MTIEESKNSDAEEEDTSTFSPKASSSSHTRVKLNQTLSGEGPAHRENKRDHNGLGGLIKKVRGGSINPDDALPASNPLLDYQNQPYQQLPKKQTPISSERGSIPQGDKPFSGSGYRKILN